MRSRRPSALVALTLACSWCALLGCDEPGELEDAAVRDASPADAARLDASPPPVDGSHPPDGPGPRPDTGPDAGPQPRPSAGCGAASPAAGARQITVGTDTGDFIVSIPSAYDPDQPYPLGFGFHGYGRTHANCQDGDCAGFQSAMGETAVLVYMKSLDEGWEQPPVRDRNAAFFEAVLDLALAEYCIDEDRVFVAGTSSGATFSNVLACRFGDRLFAAAPVAGGIPEREGCVGQVAALVIHGVDDPHVPFVLGEMARDHYLARNGCSSEAVPALPGLHARVVADRESHECADYQGCDDGGPVRWCEHSEGGYDGSTHGWPLFGGDAIWEFVRPR